MDISLIFQATATTTNALEVIGVAVFVPPFGPFLTPTGAGAINGTGNVMVTGVAAQIDARLFTFTAPGIGLSQTSDQFFVSYTSVATDGSLNVGFMIDPVVGGLFNEEANLVPEPSTALLFAFGLLGALGVARAGSRRRA